MQISATYFVRYMQSFISLASKGFPSVYSKSVCVRLHSESSEPTMLFSQTTPDEHLSTLPPYRWPALITLRTLAKFQLVKHRIYHVVLFRSSCLFEHTLTAVCVLPEYRFDRRIPLEAYLRKASPTDIRQVVVCVCVCVRFHSEAPNLRPGFSK